jgi:hypothetical protein
MRALAAVGVVREDAERDFSLTLVGTQPPNDITGSCEPRPSPAK